MNFRRSWLAIALLACGVPAAHAQLWRPPVRDYNATTPETGTILRREMLWTSSIPLNKTWEQFSPQEKEDLLSQYRVLGPGDEPPFPVDGMKPIFSALKKAQFILRAKGELDMVVWVDEEGHATKVADMGGVHDIQLTELMQQVLLLTRYKPAVCDGEPCRMLFPFKMELKYR